MVLLQPGRHESLKAATHGAMFALAALFTLYNGAAWWSRRAPHLARNTLFYGALALLEVSHCRHHLQRLR